MTLQFRVDGTGIVPLPFGSVGPGSLTLTDCDEPNIHVVVQALKRYVASSAHINACDERQSVSWRAVKEAMNAGEGVAAIARVHTHERED